MIIQCGHCLLYTSSYYASQQLDGKGVVELKIGVTPNMSGVRIDPANVPCIVRILELECGGKERYVPDYQINGIKAGQNIILYNTIDSQIHIKMCIRDRCNICAFRGEKPPCGSRKRILVQV